MSKEINGQSSDANNTHHFILWNFLRDVAPTLKAETIDERVTGEQEPAEHTKSPDGYGPVQFHHPMPLSAEGKIAALNPDFNEQDPSMDVEKRFEFAAAPIPIVNPTIGSGAGGIATFLVRLDPDDTVSPPATTIAGGSISLYRNRKRSLCKISSQPS